MKDEDLVFALALYFGDQRLDRLRETLLPPALAQMPLPDSDYVGVHGRHDHVQHFIISAAFTLSGGIGFTTTIGEAKEFDDLLRGGSDFSFQDIAADRTGITFARIAETPAGARHLESLGSRPESRSPILSGDQRPARRDAPGPIQRDLSRHRQPGLQSHAGRYRQPDSRLRGVSGNAIAIVSDRSALPPP